MEPTLSQTLHLMVGNTIERRLRANGRISAIAKQSATPKSALEQLFILTLSRKPTKTEINNLTNLIGQDQKDEDAYRDILWGLLNSTEFSFNH